MSEPELDGQIYKPAPQIVPDTRTGFDQDGDYHCVPDMAGNDDYYRQLNTPYRLALQIQEAIVQQAEMSDYYLGLADRVDIATDIALEWFNDTTFEPPDLALQALNHWFRIYGRPTNVE